MASDPEDVRDRAWVEHRQPQITGLDDAMWFAEDPETDCAGVGLTEAEAVGNLVSVVAEYETAEGPTRPLLKLPGRVVTRSSSRSDASRSLLDRVRSLL